MYDEDTVYCRNTFNQTAIVSCESRRQPAGQIGLKIDSKILSKLSFDGVIIMVTGTNGKTSTSNLIADLLEKSGRTVLSNRRGDNMRAGVATGNSYKYYVIRKSKSRCDGIGSR